MRAVVSIHDVMPETLAPVREQLSLLAHHDIAPVTLLVVPGRDWSPDGLARLREWRARGHVLAGHGWHHHATAVRGCYHRLHAAVLSRQAAEHLALDAAEIRALVRRCRAWFADNDLGRPALYVPPAWALGPIRPAGLADLGFRYLETLTAVHDLRSGRRRRLPVIGFEADTPARAAVLRALDTTCSRWPGPVRIALHPRDHRLHLRGTLLRRLATVREPLDYDGLMAGPDSAYPHAG
ncbi:polysaccharide deacetylase family protein [Arhodomonas aquaeolei]|uniref:polysaccharide deacetylase family protein n=1 Tax=Arhodomonas aquaeolei TaxID=2369 RepID=UPI00035F3408|nr:polysaccharide deacetylase family protein [Arhodomonas aquaeolei]